MTQDQSLIRHDIGTPILSGMTLEETGFASSTPLHKSKSEGHVNALNDFSLDGSSLHNSSRTNSQSIQQPLSRSTSFQTPPMMHKRKRRPSTVTAPDQPKRDVLWITEPPLLPSDLDWNDDTVEQSTPLALASLASTYNPFRNINNRQMIAAAVAITGERMSPAMPFRRTPLLNLSFPNIPTLEDSPDTLKPITSSSSSLPSVPNVAIFGNKGPLKMRRLNSLGQR